MAPFLLGRCCFWRLLIAWLPLALRMLLLRN
jgi:hypothetical protein